MKTIVIASPRSGSTSIVKYMSKMKEINNNLVYEEPFNKSYYCVGKSYLYNEVIKNNNIFVKTISDHIPPEFLENLDLFYQTLKKDFDKIVFLDRKDFEKQIESLLHAVKTNKWHENYFYEKNVYKDINNERIKNLLKIKDIILKKSIELSCKIFYYEDIYFSEDKMKEFLIELGVIFDYDLYSSLLNPSKKYRIEKPEIKNII